MSSPIERNVAPNPFRDQYAGGLKEDADVQAALNGEPMPEVNFNPAPQPVSAAPSQQFGPMVKLR